MAYFNEKEKIVAWESFLGSDNNNYLKSEVMVALMEKSSTLAYICKNSGHRKFVFDAVKEHAEEGKGLRAKGLLLSLGDLYETRRLSKSEIDHIIKDMFSSGIADSVKRAFVYREPEREKEKPEQNSPAKAGESEGTESTETPAKKKDKGIWNYLPF